MHLPVLGGHVHVGADAPSTDTVPTPDMITSSQTGENCATIHSSSPAVVILHDVSVPHSGRLQPSNCDLIDGSSPGRPAQGA